jgi:hypothetical protein
VSLPQILIIVNGGRHENAGDHGQASHEKHGEYDQVPKLKHLGVAHFQLILKRVRLTRVNKVWVLHDLLRGLFPLVEDPMNEVLIKVLSIIPNVVGHAEHLVLAHQVQSLIGPPLLKHVLGLVQRRDERVGGLVPVLNGICLPKGLQWQTLSCA